MPLVDLWNKSKKILESKNIKQIIAISGDGSLRDDATASDEFRQFLSVVPSSLLASYANQCLDQSFDDSGLALQDIVNEIGRRLGFEVTNGRYRGVAGQIGYDGIWHFPDGFSIVAEVKKTDAYQIHLNTIALYRQSLMGQGKIGQNSSILIIVGRQATEDLEAQIRGSRHAWDMRIISVNALARLMALKEEVEEPETIRRIHSILIPREFTKLDEIFEIVFSTAQDIKLDEEEKQELENVPKDHGSKPVDFRDAIVQRIQKCLHTSLVKRYQVAYSSPDETIAVVCTISKQYDKSGQILYWYAFHPSHKQFLEGTKIKHGFVAFGCGSEKTLLLIPFADFAKWLNEMHVTQKPGRMYWHVEIYKEGDDFTLHRKKGATRIPLTGYLVK